MRMVDPAEWDLSGMEKRGRAARLLNPPSGEDLIITVAAEALEAAIQGRSSWSWQDGDLMPGAAEQSRRSRSIPTRSMHFSTAVVAIVLSTIFLAKKASLSMQCSSARF